MPAGWQEGGVGEGRKGGEWRRWGGRGENEVGRVKLGVERGEWGGKGEGECREGVRVGWG